MNFTPIPGKTVLDQENTKSGDGSDLKKAPSTGQMKKYENLARPNEKDMIIFVGAPGSGKSTFYREFLSHCYYRINNDSLKNPKKAPQILRNHLNTCE